DGVVADAVVTEATVGTFPLPTEMSAVDGQVVPGTGLVVEVGRDPRQLAEWSGYMGNCIGQSWYAEQAERGQCVLMALRDESGRIVANLDIRRRGAGWDINELRARFNDAVDPALEEHIKRWVTTLAPREHPTPPTPEPKVRARDGGTRRTTTRLPAAVVRALTTEVTRTLATAGPARRTYAALANHLNPQADFEPAAAVIALKRLGATQHADLLRRALAAGLSAAAIWRATSVRPLATAVSGLTPDLRTRLAALTEGAPLPKTLRALVRRPEIAPAHAMDVVARATRKAMGTLLDDDALTRSVARRPSPNLVCALTIATTCAIPSTVDTTRVAEPGTTAVPGFPATDLLDEQGPWHHAIPAAADLGAQVDAFTTRVAEHGLLVPSALLGKGGWQALWHRAHR
ncbi:MAG: hypothetical protein M3422_25675, partial [Actinomycetota bacterium]|nr:hypothetical protein [Actinomycetota bacterium]